MLDSHIFLRPSVETYSVEEIRDFNRRTLSPKRKNTLADSILSQKCKTTTNEKIKDYTYISEHKDVEAILRIRSAAASKRSVLKRPTTKLPKKPKVIESRIESVRNTNEYEIPVKNSVKIQEKIRNELL